MIPVKLYTVPLLLGAEDKERKYADQIGLYKKLEWNLSSIFHSFFFGQVP